jgi:Tol biopolymer transport system component
MDPAGNNKKDISVHGTGEWRMPSWSGDAEQIVHIRYIGVGFPEIFIMDKNGKNSIRLTNNHRDDRYPDWSPIGGTIAWSSNRPGEPLQIWVMDEDGGNKKQLTTKGGKFPCFSPDGQKIVYVGGDEMVDNPLLWVMDADGGNKYQLTFKKIWSE